jgi:AcrR family transcriptional regulator
MGAALAELAHSGYAAFRMEGVASRAAVNKTTIYRRWPSREALISAVVERMKTPLRERPLPDTGQLESDLIEAFSRRFGVAQSVEGQAWARLRDERHNAEVEAIIGRVVDDRRDEWRSMVSRAVGRGELPPGTNAQLLLELVRAIVDSRSTSHRLDASWLTLAVRTVLAGARAGTLVRGHRTATAATSGGSRKARTGGRG